MTNYKPSTSNESNFRDLLDQTDEEYLLPRKAFITIRKSKSKVPQERRTTAVTKKQPSCRGKVRYRRLCVALRDADQVMQDVSLMFEVMHVYICPSCTKSKRSLVFHKGHARRMHPAKALAYAESSRRRARERANKTNTATPIIERSH